MGERFVMIHREVYWDLFIGPSPYGAGVKAKVLAWVAYNSWGAPVKPGEPNRKYTEGKVMPARVAREIGHSREETSRAISDLRKQKVLIRDIAGNLGIDKRVLRQKRDEYITVLKKKCDGNITVLRPRKKGKKPKVCASYHASVIELSRSCDNSITVDPCKPPKEKEIAPNRLTDLQTNTSTGQKTPVQNKRPLLEAVIRAMILNNPERFFVRNPQKVEDKTIEIGGKWYRLPNIKEAQMILNLGQELDIDPAGMVELSREPIRSYIAWLRAARKYIGQVIDKVESYGAWAAKIEYDAMIAQEKKTPKQQPNVQIDSPTPNHKILSLGDVLAGLQQKFGPKVNMGLP